MQIKSKNQRIFLLLRAAKFRENGHKRFCYLSKDNVSAAMRRESPTRTIMPINTMLRPLATTEPSYWFADVVQTLGFYPRTSAYEAEVHSSVTRICLPITSFKMAMNYRRLQPYHH